VNKTTVYRRWPTKSALVTAAVRAVAGFDEPVPDTGSARADLVEVLRRWTASAGTADGRAVARLLTAGAEHPEVAEIARGLGDEARRRRLSILERAQARGEVPTGVDAWLVLDAIVAPVVTRVLRRGDAVDDATIVRLVDLVMTGVEHGGGRVTAA
jgi:AcrR family transcriptional regulator